MQATEARVSGCGLKSWFSAILSLPQEVHFIGLDNLTAVKFSKAS